MRAPPRVLQPLSAEVKPLLLDLYCGAGGAATGYMRAGFDVVGVDIVRRDGYPGRFIRADALDFLSSGRASGFHVIHASPPCQGYSRHVTSSSSQWAGTLGKDEPRLIAPTRELIQQLCVPYVIENVTGAADELVKPMLLCGIMFGLPLPRHRLFEVSPRVVAHPYHRRCHGAALAYARDRGWDRRVMSVTGKGRDPETLAQWAQIMGWRSYTGSQHGMREAIPPAYTHYIGAQLLRTKLRHLVR